jgi:orotidine-5'-phosphate decarboxylase
MKNKFTEKIQERSKNISSRIVLALDYTKENPETLEKKAVKIIEKLERSIVAIKINYHLLIPLELKKVQNIIGTAHKKGILAIADIKLNDISSTNLIVGDNLWQAGFDAIIANPIAGYHEGIEPLIEQAHKIGKGIILLVYMSHKGAEDGYGLTVKGENNKQSKLYELFLEKALNWEADGVIIGATKPDIISYSAEKLNGRIPIFCPGVGFQGGSHIDAVKAGANFLIIGRTILDATDSLEITELIRRDVCGTHLKI